MKSERAREQARNRKIQEREGHAAEEEEHSERRRLSVFSASARRQRAAGHLRQVEKKHSHDPHPGVTGQLEYDHPVSYAVTVAKKPAEEAEPEQLAAEAAASAARRLRGGRA